MTLICEASVLEHNMCQVKYLRYENQFILSVKLYVWLTLTHNINSQNSFLIR